MSVEDTKESRSGYKSGYQRVPESTRGRERRRGVIYIMIATYGMVEREHALMREGRGAGNT